MRNIEEIFGGVVENQSQKPWTYIATGLETQEPDGTYSIPIPFVFSTMLCFNNGNLQTEAQVWADSTKIYFIDQLEEGDTLFFLFNSSMSVDRIKAGNISEYKFIVPQGGLESFVVDRKFDHIIVTINGATQANEITCSVVGQTVYPAVALEEGDLVYCLLIQGELDNDDKITNLEAVSRDYKVSVNEVVIGRQETPLDGVKVLFDPIEQTGWLIPDCKGEKIVAFNPPMLKTDKQEIDLTQFNIDRNNFFLKPQYSFEKGFTLQHGLQTVIFEGQEYRWGGEFPKTVRNTETPDNESGWVRLKIDRLNSLVCISETDGNLQNLIDSGYGLILIDEDYVLKERITIKSNTNIKTIRGAKILVKNGVLVTESISPPQYWKSTTINPMIKITKDVIEKSSQIQLENTSKLKVGDKLVLKNGYCDMWRVLEKSGDYLRGTSVQPYKSEIVTINKVEGEVVTVSPTHFSYPVTPPTYGFFEDENNISDYAGYTTPSATPMLYKNISLDLDVEIQPDHSGDFITFSFVDGLDLSIRSDNKSVERTNMGIVITMSVVNIHDVYCHNHYMKFLTVKETCRGFMENLTATSWQGGHDTPFLAMLNCDIIADKINVDNSSNQSGTSAFYMNTCFTGMVSNVVGKNLVKVVDLSFSNGIVANNLVGYNVDFIFGAYCSTNCTVSSGVVDGYHKLNSNSNEYTKSTIASFDTINLTIRDMKRNNDKGYGRILVQNTKNLKMQNVSCENTLLNIFITSLDKEIAVGEDTWLAFIHNSEFGSLRRDSSYYNSETNSWRTYPLIHFSGVLKNGAKIGKNGNQFDRYDIDTQQEITIGATNYGVTITGFAKTISLETGANKNTCIPNTENLVLRIPPLQNSFIDLETILTTPNTSIGLSWEHGVRINDIDKKSVFINIGQRGSPKWKKLYG